VLGDNNRVMSAQHRTDEERPPGRYRGIYSHSTECQRCATHDSWSALVDINGDVATHAVATSPCSYWAVPTPARGEQLPHRWKTETIASPLTVRVTAAPGGLSKFSVRAEGVRYLFFDTKRNLAHRQGKQYSSAKLGTAAFTLSAPQRIGPECML
jgi:hypothetical protein